MEQHEPVAGDHHTPAGCACSEIPLAQHLPGCLSPQGLDEAGADPALQEAFPITYLWLAGCNQPQHPPHTHTLAGQQGLALPLPPKNVCSVFKFHPLYSGAARIFNIMSFLGL